MVERAVESAASAHRGVIHHIRVGDWRTADAECRRLTAQYPDFAEGWFAASNIAMALRSAAHALDAIDRAIGLARLDLRYQMHRALCLLALDRRRQALDAADSVERCTPTDPKIWDAIGTVRTRALEPRGALAAYSQAVALAPNDANFIFNRATVRRFLGDLEGAEADYDRAIALRPEDYEAYLNRSELRVQTAQRNHVAELEALAARSMADWRGEVQVRFALAKEYEDLGEYSKSFEQLRRGARKRREHVKYDVTNDVSTVDWIMRAFPACPPDTAPGVSKESPIFIVGLPRSGTTLVERIVSSHSLVVSAGELDCFASALVDAARARSGRTQLPRQELVALSATLDFAGIGQEYLRRARATFDDSRRFIDKMPLNYLYCGLIHRALPQARIIHVTRHPMAVGYAMYKTLFKSGYPFSYDLGEIGRYYIAYHQLMQHWKNTMPGVMYEVSYEDLVADHVGEARKLLDYCGIEWEDACAAFHLNSAPATTASASQVRRPIYSSSVLQWQNYEKQLSELRDVIEASGLDTGPPDTMV